MGAVCLGERSSRVTRHQVMSLETVRWVTKTRGGDTIMRLQGKVALITGAASGIGRETALLFAAEGASVVAVDIDDYGGERTVNAIAASGSAAIYVHADVSSAAECEEMVAKTEEKFGRLDVLFNNAGIMHSGDDDAVATDEAVWDLTMAINLKGVFLGCKYGIPALRRAGGGSIINTASFVALLGAATPQLAYTASKGGVLALTRELAVVHARENIRVNALCPGPLRTELLMSFLNTDEKKQRRLVHVPMGRFGEAKEMAQAALFLASDESSYATGTEFVVDGGITAAYVTPE
jgi:NAD(P)-dependent dehydrogenase (short-subunit alcohol dehydrogenase family)